MTNYGYGTSLNGWGGIPADATGDSATVRAQKVALRSAHLATGTVPGTTRKVTTEKAALPLFLAYLADWHHQVMPIDGSLTYRGPDGWLYRDARTGAGLSNHASGTAVDVRYDVLKADHQRHMTPAQTAAVHRLLDRYVSATGRRVFGWGGDWTVGTYCDEMHTELAQSWSPGTQGRATVPSDVAEVIARLRIRPDGTIAPLVPPPAEYPGKPIGWGSSAAQAIATMQRALAAYYPDYGIRITGTYLAAVKDASGKVLDWRDQKFRMAIGRWALGHPWAFLRDGARPGVIGPSMYASILTRYPIG